MAIDKVRNYLKKWNADGRVLEFEVSSATVELAAQALHCEGKRIAKTLSFDLGDRCILIVTAGDAKIDNAKYKAKFGKRRKCFLPSRWKRKSDMPWEACARLL